MSSTNTPFNLSHKVVGFDSSLYTQFLLNQTSYCLYNTQTKYYCKTFYVDKNLWFKNFASTKLQICTALTYLVDGAQSRSNANIWTLAYNTNNMLTDERNLFLTQISTNFFYISSISKLFASSVWLERELSDFSGLNFLGLTDTRRLLLDYFEEKKNWSTHISNDKNYNNILYDITLSY